jgi:hypothetical protein
MLNFHVKYSLKTLAIVGVLSMVLMSSCTKSSNTEELKPEATSSFSLMQDRIITPSCASAGCHASEADNAFKQHGLVLVKGLAFKNLLGVSPKNTSAKADNFLLVKAFNSAQSLFYHKLQWDVSHHGGKQYGSPMPLGGNALSVGQLEFVRRWIEAGAPEKGDVVDKTLLDDKTPSYIVDDGTFEAMKTPAQEGATGLQLKIERFSIQPNFEREIFVRRALGNTSEIYVNRIKLKSRANSHHLVVYDFRDKTSLPSFDAFRDLRNSDNSVNILTAVQASNHIFLGGGTDPNSDYVFPEGTALALPANASVDLNPHYFNRTTEVKYGENNINLYTVDKSKVKNVVKIIDFNNTNFSLPAKTKTVITKDFKFDTDVNIVALTSHNHALGEKFVIKIKGGTRDGEVVYENSDWEHPIFINYPKPIALKKGEGLTSIVTYNNTTSKTITFGLTSQDEMNIIFGYYY